MVALIAMAGRGDWLIQPLVEGYRNLAKWECPVDQGFRFLAKRECPALEGFHCSAKWERSRLAKLGARGSWGRFCGEVGTNGTRLAFVEGVGAAFLFPLLAKMECLGSDSMFGARFGVWDVIWPGLLRCGDV